MSTTRYILYSPSLYQLETLTGSLQLQAVSRAELFYLVGRLARIALVAATMLYNASIVSLQVRVLRPQSGFTNNFSGGKHSKKLEILLLMNSMDGTTGE
mmetsp:Transcript_4122/g.4776  ORF Transcript_4122/g.4776 Transcript_4122/m.4776 type:complete len:99 (+) Transcript_4122:44-340(+)